MVQMNDQLNALRLFVRVAQTGSFSRAAKDLSLTQPTASRIVALLERELGATLLVRTTRAVTLTEVGKDYLDRIQPILSALEDADSSVRGGERVRGAVRVGTSSSLASRVLVPMMTGFTDRFPEIRVELIIDDKRQDLIGEGVDVALRWGKLADSTAVARKLGSWPLQLVASPEYVASRGAPATPEDLVHHNAIVAGPLGASWTFRKNDHELTIKTNGRVAINSSEVAVNAAVAGIGVVVGSAVSFHEHLQNGTLVQLLQDWSLGDIDIHAVYPGGQPAKPAAKVFTESLLQEIRGGHA